LAVVTKPSIHADLGSGLDYDSCHDAFFNPMTSVMIVQGSSAPHGRVAEVAVLRPAAVSDTEAVLAMLARRSRRLDQLSDSGAIS
jgi:hypothetical protein